MSDITATLQLLNTLSPVRTLVHIGVGQGLGILPQWRPLAPAHVVLIDAEDQPSTGVTRLLEAQPDWRWLSATLADRNDTCDYHHASHANESGLIPPAQLKPYWPNIRAIEQHPVQTDTLDSIVEAQGIGPIHWLVIDCLPAQRILRGAEQALQQCEVVWVRALLNPVQDALTEAAADSIQALLAQHAFHPVAQIEGTHPQVAEILYVRHWQQALQPILQHWQTAHAELAEQHRQASEAQQALTAQRDSLQSQLTQLTDAHSASQQSHANAQAHSAALEKEKADLTIARDQHAQQVAERQTQIEQLTQARDTEAHAKAEAIAQRDAEAQAKAEAQARIAALEKEKADLAAAKDGQIAALTKEKTDLTAARDGLAKEKADLTTARDQHAQQAAERQAQIEQLTQARDAEAKAKADAIAQREAEAQAKTEAQARIAALEKEKADLAATKDGQIAALTQEKADLVAAREGLAKEKADLTTARDQHAQQAAERQAQIEQLTQARDAEAKAKEDALAEVERRDRDMAEAQYQRQLMSEEMLKAEAQLDLIKDVLLREPGL